MHKLVVFLLLGLFLTVQGECVYVSKYELLVGQGEGYYLIQLEILPNGQIIDPNKNFYLNFYPGGMALHPNGSLFYVSARTTMFSFQIEKDGNLFPFDTTFLTDVPYMFDITPNGEIMIFNTGKIYAIDTNGKLSNTGNTWGLDPLFAIDPLGRIMISSYSWDTPRGNDVYQIDYDNKQLIKTQTLSWSTANGAIGDREMEFTPDGRMIFYRGLFLDYPSNLRQLRVFSVDSLGIVSTLQEFSFTMNPTGMSITPNGWYLYLNTDGTDSTVLLEIDSANYKVTDTGRRLSVPPGVEVWDYVLSPDGVFALITYYAPATLRQMLTTAFLGGNGDVYWTGYTFPFEETYGPIGAKLIIPIYSTDILKEEWLLYD